MADTIALMKQKVLDLGLSGELTSSDISKWEEREMLSICKLTSGEKKSGETYKYLQVKYLRGHREADLKSKGNFLQKDDLVILVDGENSGEIFEVPCSGYMGSTFRKLEYTNDIIREFLRLFIVSHKKLLRNSKTGSAIPHLDKKLFSRLEVNLPPLAEQKRIVAKIESLFTVIDQIDKRKQDSLTIIEKIRQTSLQNAIMGQLVEQNENDEPASELVNKIQAQKKQLIKEKKIKKENMLSDIKEEDLPFEIPENWNWIRLGDILRKIGSGSTPKGGNSVYVEAGIPFIRSQNVYNDGLRLKNVAYITEETNNSKSGSQVFAGDILLNITGASIGRCAIVPDNFEVGNVNQHVLINRPIDTRTRQYLHIALTSPYIFNEIMSLQKGGTKEGLSATNAKMLKIPLPPLAEQKRIVEKFNQIMAICDQMEALLYGSSSVNVTLKVVEE